MKCVVKCLVRGKVFEETVYSKDYAEAKELVLIRYPNATVIGVNAEL